MFFSEVSFSSFVFRSFSLQLPSFSSSMIITDFSAKKDKKLPTHSPQNIILY